MPIGGRKHEDMPLHNHLWLQAFPEQSAEDVIHSWISVLQSIMYCMKHWNWSFRHENENKAKKHVEALRRDLENVSKNVAFVQRECCKRNDNIYQTKIETDSIENKKK